MRLHLISIIILLVSSWISAVNAEVKDDLRYPDGTTAVMVLERLGYDCGMTGGGWVCTGDGETWACEGGHWLDKCTKLKVDFSDALKPPHMAEGDIKTTSDAKLDAALSAVVKALSLSGQASITDETNSDVVEAIPKTRACTIRSRMHSSSILTCDFQSEECCDFERVCYTPEDGGGEVCVMEKTNCTSELSGFQCSVSREK